MRIYFDCQYVEHGSTVEPISVGMVKENGSYLYLESEECDLSLASPWIKRHVLPLLQANGTLFPKRVIRDKIVKFLDKVQPEFWGWYTHYDWVAFCHLFGGQTQLPAGWPRYCMDLKGQQQLLGVDDSALPPCTGRVHHALDDARWIRDIHQALKDYARFQLSPAQCADVYERI